MINDMKKNTRLFAFLYNAVLAAVAVFIYCPFFEENDDAFIAMISEGVFGTRDPHVIYPNVIYGKLLTLLNSVFGQVRWHSVMQYILIFLAMYSLTVFLIELTGRRMPAVIFTLLTFYELYVSVQYSKTSAFAAMTGFILMLYEAYTATSKEGKADNKRIFTGSVLLIAAALLRDSSFFLAGIFAIVLCLFDMIILVDRKRGLKLYKMLSVYVTVFAPSLIIILLCSLYNREIYGGDAKWTTFMEYNAKRTELLDFRYDLLDINRYKDKMEEEGISENDALLYLTWQFGDDNVLDVEKMDEILTNGSPRPVDLSMMKTFVANIHNDIFIIDPVCFLCLVLIIFMLLPSGKGDTKSRRKSFFNVCMILAESVIFFGILFYFNYSGRWCHRVVYGAMLAFASVLMYLFISKFYLDAVDENDGNYTEQTALISNNLYIALLVFTIIIDAGILVGNRFDYNDHKRTEPDYKGFYAYIQENKDELFIADTFTFQRAYKY
ncbi:MAG: hypothetical protein K6B28_11070, partial [Lachnospiraceae bacterium]|nr:hypothetical protein [Lachnospiraceae bacterium]